jgi:hypothetical protein
MDLRIDKIPGLIPNDTTIHNINPNKLTVTDEVDFRALLQSMYHFLHNREIDKGALVSEEIDLLNGIARYLNRK